MSDTTTKVREHYNGSGILDRMKAALEPITAQGQPITVSVLAPADHFHTRGILATADLADAVGLSASMRVLDLGSGLGGPARYFAATSGCRVEGVDLSPAFVDAANFLTELCGLQGRATFRVGNALEIPFEKESFDAVFLHHVAMNIENRAALYAEIHRVLKPKGQFALHDVVLHDGDVVYPTPWALDSSTSFLMTEADTRAFLEHAGFSLKIWSDDTPAAGEWFKSVMERQATGPSPLSTVLGPEFPGKLKNLAKNITENRVGVLSAVCVRG
jgi:SAM-dependent methyltransferase